MRAKAADCLARSGPMQTDAIVVAACREAGRATRCRSRRRLASLALVGAPPWLPWNHDCYTPPCRDASSQKRQDQGKSPPFVGAVRSRSWCRIRTAKAAADRCSSASMQRHPARKSARPIDFCDTDNSGWYLIDRPCMLLLRPIARCPCGGTRWWSFTRGALVRHTAVTASHEPDEGA